jgi:hypothetical protein
MRRTKTGDVCIENRVPRRILGLRRKRITGGLRKLFHDSVSSNVQENYNNED